mmetsp:Transcript_89168/g.257061  ORF Transcript_89168/g.257061 Transcript_89168/m.257061 type:complete len:229 (+) Transcript_89168:293-979(+)
MSAHALGENPLLDSRARRLVVIEVPSELLCCVCLRARIGHLAEIRMNQGSRGCDPPMRIKCQQLAHEFQALLGGIRDLLLEGAILRLRRHFVKLQRVDHVQNFPLRRALHRQPSEVAVPREVQHDGDPAQHVDLMLPSKQDLPAQDLRMDATDGPQVDRLEVPQPGGEKHQLWRAIPTGHNVVGHLLVQARAAPRKPQVRNPQGAVLIHEDVGRLEVPVDDAGGVQVL